MKSSFNLKTASAIIFVILAGCTPLAGRLQKDPAGPSSLAVGELVPATATPFKPLPTATVTPTPTEPPEIPVWIPEWIPEQLSSAIDLKYPYIDAENESDSMIRISLHEVDNPDFTWVYALVAPFPTIRDDISSEELRGVWSGTSDSSYQILVDESTLGVFKAKWGDPELDKVRVVIPETMLDTAWAEKYTLALIPFEEISPRWKVLRVDGLSPLDGSLDLVQYPLVARFNWEGRIPIGQGKVGQLRDAGYPTTNRDEGKLTRILLTGTTALVRLTAERMETKGIDYPIGDILPWLLDADFTHISNEISFYDQCPPASPERLGTRFCSNPDYIELLDLIEVDVVELTGNHLIDYGRKSFSSTLEMYEERGIQTYGGGANLSEAIEPLIIEHHGNRIAFLGCNRAGPESVWATDDRAGAAPCDLDRMASDIQNLLDEGILPIVTFQHYELEDFLPITLARQEMQQMAEAGAVVVSGSQAHFPHGFTFVGDNFVHYGLGNLFFDQMWPNHRREFLDRHVFYDGRYLGVEVMTAMLEDYARPRPMTLDERTKMLTTYFEVSGWQISDKD